MNLAMAVYKMDVDCYMFLEIFALFLDGIILRLV